ncbi:O-antigen ligase family protein [Sphingomonas sp. ASY06-1R]|uniref:O-antigen ligase family protein n=1 Tax=Sphingomonas sp. ASY06-1R TaxID=3445771 RepID=UPI003FA21EB5
MEHNAVAHADRQTSDPTARARALAARVMFIGIILPSQFTVNVAGSTLNFSRVAILISAALLLPSVKNMRWRLPDILIMISAVWPIISLSTTSKSDWDSGVIALIEIAGPYFIARLSFRKLSEVAIFLRFCFPLVVFLVSVMAFEALSHRQLFGPISGVTKEELVRMGLMRSAGPFGFPILAGIFCASLFGPFLTGLNRHRRIGAVASIIGVAASVSSGAIAGVLIQIGLTLYRNAFIRLGTPKRWHIFALMFFTLWLFVDITSNRGFFKVLLGFLAFNSSTAYYRLLIWEYAGAVALNNPIFGVGFDADWERLSWMTSSIDAFWLQNAVAYGLPTPVMLGLASLGTIICVGKRASYLPATDSAFLMSYNFSLIGLLASGFTVHYWTTMLIWLTFFIGMCLSLSEAQIGSATGTKLTKPAIGRGPLYQQARTRPVSPQAKRY